MGFGRRLFPNEMSRFLGVPRAFLNATVVNAEVEVEGGSHANRAEVGCAV
jgi:hypothetical protein